MEVTLTCVVRGLYRTLIVEGPLGQASSWPCCVPVVELSYSLVNRSSRTPVREFSIKHDSFKVGLRELHGDSQ